MASKVGEVVASAGNGFSDNLSHNGQPLPFKGRRRLAKGAIELILYTETPADEFGKLRISGEGNYYLHTLSFKGLPQIAYASDDVGDLKVLLAQLCGAGVFDGAKVNKANLDKLGIQQNWAGKIPGKTYTPPAASSGSYGGYSGGASAGGGGNATGGTATVRIFNACPSSVKVFIGTVRNNSTAGGSTKSLGGNSRSSHRAGVGSSVAIMNGSSIVCCTSVSGDCSLSISKSGTGFC